MSGLLDRSPGCSLFVIPYQTSQCFGHTNTVHAHCAIDGETERIGGILRMQLQSQVLVRGCIDQ